MILICELECWGLAHVPINSAFLQIVRNSYPEEQVIFAGERSHLLEIQKIVYSSKTENVSWQEIALPPRHAKPRQRFKFDLKMVNQLLRQLPQDQNSYMVITSNNVSVLTAVKYWMRKKYPSAGIQVVLHADITALNNRLPLNPLRRWQHVRRALQYKGNHGLQYLVLEDHIRESLICILPELTERVAVLDHPVSPAVQAIKFRSLEPPVHFGYLGFANRNKGFLQFLEVAGKMQALHSKQAKFHAVGMLHPALSGTDVSLLNTEPTSGMLDRSRFIQLSQIIDYACFLYQWRHYNLCASGALLDAIALEKPLIALDIPMFSVLFEKYGDIGYLCQDVDHMVQQMSSMVTRPDPDRHRRQVENIRHLKQERSVDFLAQKYRRIVEEWRS
jgi:hypothetical protein